MSVGNRRCVRLTYVTERGTDRGLMTMVLLWAVHRFERQRDTTPVPILSVNWQFIAAQHSLHTKLKESRCRAGYHEPSDKML